MKEVNISVEHSSFGCEEKAISIKVNISTIQFVQVESTRLNESSKKYQTEGSIGAKTSGV